LLKGFASGPSDFAACEVLDLQPRERLPIEAGRVPADLKPFLSQPRVPELLRAVGKLSETEQEEVRTFSFL
jgi:hypothetical protein